MNHVTNKKEIVAVIRLQEIFEEIKNPTKPAELVQAYKDFAVDILWSITQ